MSLAQRPIGSVIHNEVRRFAMHAKVCDAYDIGMDQVGDGLSFLQEALHIVFVRHFDLEDFDSDLRFEVNMLAKVDFGESPTPDGTIDAVVAKLLICTVCHPYTSFVGNLSWLAYFNELIVEAYRGYVKRARRKLLLPFCSCGGRHGLLTSRIMSVVVVVAVVGQFQEEML